MSLGGNQGAGTPAPGPGIGEVTTPEPALARDRPASWMPITWQSPRVEEIATTFMQARRMVREGADILLAAYGDEKRLQIALLIKVPKRELLRRLAFAERHDRPLPRMRRRIDEAWVWIDA